MITKELTCIECPLGCHIEVDLEYDNKVAAVRGNSCPRGKAYAESEVVCPVRVLTSSVRATNGAMVCVKTDKPIKKSEIFDIMKRINRATCTLSIKIGDVIVENIADGVNLVATGNFDK